MSDSGEKIRGLAAEPPPGDPDAEWLESEAGLAVQAAKDTGSRFRVQGAKAWADRLRAIAARLRASRPAPGDPHDFGSEYEADLFSAGVTAAGGSVMKAFRAGRWEVHLRASRPASAPGEPLRPDDLCEAAEMLEELAASEKPHHASAIRALASRLRASSSASAPAGTPDDAALRALDKVFECPSPVRAEWDSQGSPTRWTFDGRSWFGTRAEAMRELLAECGRASGAPAGTPEPGAYYAEMDAAVADLHREYPHGPTQAKQ